MVKAGVDLWASKGIVMKPALTKSTGQLLFSRKTKKGQAPDETRKKEHGVGGVVNAGKITANYPNPFPTYNYEK